MAGSLKITVEARFFVCINGVPVGSMWDQFEAGELRQPFPFRRTGNNFKTEQEASQYAEAMRAYVREIESLPVKMKAGRGAQNWRLHEDEKEQEGESETSHRPTKF